MLPKPDSETTPAIASGIMNGSASVRKWPMMQAMMSLRQRYMRTNSNCIGAISIAYRHPQYGMCSAKSSASATAAARPSRPVTIRSRSIAKPRAAISSEMPAAAATMSPSPAGTRMNELSWQLATFNMLFGKKNKSSSLKIAPAISTATNSANPSPTSESVGRLRPTDDSGLRSTADHDAEDHRGRNQLVRNIYQRPASVLRHPGRFAGAN